MSDVAVNYYATNATMSREEIIRFQILLYCHLTGIEFTDKGRKTINDTELECLTLIGLRGPWDLNHLCEQVTRLKIFKNSQSARNTFSTLVIKGLLTKEGTSKKKIQLHPDIKIQTSGNIIVDIKSLYRDTQIN